MERRRFPFHSNINLRRLCFHRCLSPQGGGCLPQGMLGYTPPGRYPSGRYTPWQVHPSPWAGTPPGRYTPPGQVHPPGGYIPPAGTSPPAGTPPLRSACWDMVNKRAVRIPLECILVDIIVIVVIFCSYIRNLHSGEKKSPTDSGQDHQKSPAAKPKRPYPLQNRSPYTAKFPRLQVNRIHEL